MADSRERVWSAGHGAYTEQNYGGGLDAWRGYAGRGPKNYRRSDERIREDVNEQLTFNGDVDASDIEVSVRDGDVTLEGTVETRNEKRIAEECAWKVGGVRDVYNRLKVNVTDPAYGRRA